MNSSPDNGETAMATQLLEPESIDTAYVPRFRDDVVTVPVKDEAVLYEEETGRLHQLDPIATIVCSLFDARTPLAGVIDELVDAFQADRAVIESDVLRLTRDLGRSGLFQDVRGEQREEEAEDGC